MTPLDGLRAAFGDDEVTHLAHPDDDPGAVRAADLVIAVVGYTKDDEGEYIDTAGTAALAGELFPPRDHPQVGLPVTPPTPGPESGDGAGEARDDHDPGGMSPGGDRDSLRLSDADEALIAAAAALRSDVVVSIQCGSAVMVPWADSVGAVLVSWYSGVEGGNALADVMTGAVEPGGRLPFAIPADQADLVPFDKNASEITYDLLHGQWHLDATGTPAAYPFGAGLGYTTWSIDGFDVDGDEVRASVRNTGERAGSTVVFVHASVPGSSVERPPKRLVGFMRVHAVAGEEKSVGIGIDWRQLDVRRNGGWWSEPGAYELHVGFDAATAVGILSVERG